MKYLVLFWLFALLLIAGCTSTTEKASMGNSITVKTIENKSTASNISVKGNLSVTENKTYSFNDEFAYFYSSKCSACKEIWPLLSEIKGNFSKYAKFNEYDVITKEGMASFQLFLVKHNITKAYVPTIIIGNKTLVGLDQITRATLYASMFDCLGINESDLQ